MTGGLQFDRKRKLTAPYRRQQFLARLDRTLCPAMLLRFEAVHIHRQLRRSYDVGKINESPARELGAIAKIEVFAQRIVLPPSALFDTRTSPQTGGSIEIKKTAAPAARSLLQQEMSIQKNRLHAGEEGINAIQVAPSGLDHSYFRIGKEMNSALQKVWLGDKIGIKNTE